jgi:hypothetical protein
MFEFGFITAMTKKACQFGRLKIKKKKKLVCSWNVWKNTASCKAIFEGCKTGFPVKNQLYRL